MEISTHLTHLIKELYQNQKAAIKVSYSLNEFFNISQRVRQGCILSPHLFNIYSEKKMREALEGFNGNIKMGGGIITNLADDIVLIAGSMQELETIVARVKLTSGQAGLMRNTQKTKVMKMTVDPENFNVNVLIVNGGVIETVDKFTYLDATFTNDCNDSKEIRRR